MYMFEIHKDSKILYTITHLSEGSLFSSAIWKDIAKKQMSHFFSSPFPYSFDLKLLKMKTESSGLSFKGVYYQWNWSPLWRGSVCYLKDWNIGLILSSLDRWIAKVRTMKKTIALHIKSRYWKENYGKNVYHKNQNMWIIGTEMESGFDWNYSSLRF